MLLLSNQLSLIATANFYYDSNHGSIRLRKLLLIYIISQPQTEI